MSQHHLDATKMLCPMPVIKTQNKVKTLKRGDLLEIMCTDPGAINDIPAWCRINGHQFINHEERGDLFIINIKVCDA